MVVGWTDNIILLSDSYKASHWKQYPPGTEYVYSYFESRGCEREGWESVCFFGLQYFLKRYLTGQVVTQEKIEEAAKLYAEHFGDGKNKVEDMFNREGWEYILEKHGGRLPVKIKAVPEGMVIPNKTVLVTVVNTDPKCFWLTNFLETLLVQVWYPMTVCTNSRNQKISIQKYLEETGNEDWKVPNGAAFKLHDFGFRGVSSVESAALGGLSHLVNFLGTDTIAAVVAANRYYNCKKAAGFSIPASEHSTITSWGTDGEVDAMRNMLEQYPEGLVACVSDSFDVFKACREYWGDELKDLVKGRISGDKFGRLVVRPDSGDPAETCVQIVSILAEQFKEDVTYTSKGYKVLPPYIRIIQGDGVDYESIPKILQRFKEEGFAADNIAFGSGGALLQKLNRDTFKVAFKCSEIIIHGEGREVFKDPITDDGKASKKGRLTLQLADDVAGYQEEDLYKPRQGADGVKGGTGFLHFTKDGAYVTVASGKGDIAKDLLVDVFENGDLLKDWTLAEIRKKADVINGPFSQGDEEPEEEIEEKPVPVEAPRPITTFAGVPAPVLMSYGGAPPGARPVTYQPPFTQSGSLVSAPMYTTGSGYQPGGFIRSPTVVMHGAPGTLTGAAPGTQVFQRPETSVTTSATAIPQPIPTAFAAPKVFGAPCGPYPSVATGSVQVIRSFVAAPPLPAGLQGTMPTVPTTQPQPQQFRPSYVAAPVPIKVAAAPGAFPPAVARSTSGFGQPFYFPSQGQPLPPQYVQFPRP